jgi:hypothetical protein
LAERDAPTAAVIFIGRSIAILVGQSLQGTDRQGEIRKKRSPPTRACPSTSGEIKPMPCASTALRKSIGIRIIKQGLDFLTNETTRATGIYADGACCLIEVPR